MRLDTAVNRLRELGDEIDEFGRQCREEEYTDTGEAWALLDSLRYAINDVILSWGN